MTKYRFAGEGAGVPGLPHEITEEEAAEAGLSELLQAAIANGNYQAAAGRPVSTETGAEPARPSRKTKES
jgi:hypothetical protein